MSQPSRIGPGSGLRPEGVAADYARLRSASPRASSKGLVRCSGLFVTTPQGSRQRRAGRAVGPRRRKPVSFANQFRVAFDVLQNQVTAVINFMSGKPTRNSPIAPFDTFERPSSIVDRFVAVVRPAFPADGNHVGRCIDERPVQVEQHGIEIVVLNLVATHSPAAGSTSGSSHRDLDPSEYFLVNGLYCMPMLAECQAGTARPGIRVRRAE